MKSNTLAGMLGLFVATAIASPGHAQLTQITTRSALNGNLTVPWTLFGPVGSSQSVYEQAQDGPELVHINSSSGILDISQQGNGFSGDFTSGAVVLLQPNPDDGETVGFAPSVLGLGFDIDPIGFTGAYTAYLQVSDAGGSVIGPLISVTGTAGSGVAPFLGVTSASDPIAYFNVGLVEPSNPDTSQGSLGGIPVLGNIAIDQISLLTQVPEPGSVVAFLSSVLMLFSARRFMR